MLAGLIWSNRFEIRGGSKTAATFKMDLFVIIANGWKPLTIITKCSILDVAAVLDPPLEMALTWTRNERRMEDKGMTDNFVLKKRAHQIFFSNKLTLTCSMSTIETLEKSSKLTIKTPDLLDFSSIPIVDFEPVNVCWVCNVAEVLSVIVTTYFVCGKFFLLIQSWLSIFILF